MEGQELKLMVDILIGNTGDGIPGQRTALGSGKVLHRMEREGGKIRNAPTGFPFRDASKAWAVSALS